MKNILFISILFIVSSCSNKISLDEEELKLVEEFILTDWYARNLIRGGSDEDDEAKYVSLRFFKANGKLSYEITEGGSSSGVNFKSDDELFKVKNEKYGSGNNVYSTSEYDGLINKWKEIYLNQFVDIYYNDETSQLAIDLYDKKEDKNKEEWEIYGEGKKKIRIEINKDSILSVFKRQIGFRNELTRFYDSRRITQFAGYPDWIVDAGYNYFLELEYPYGKNDSMYPDYLGFKHGGFKLVNGKGVFEDIIFYSPPVEAGYMRINYVLNKREVITHNAQGIGGKLLNMKYGSYNLKEEYLYKEGGSLKKYDSILQRKNFGSSNETKRIHKLEDLKFEFDRSEFEDIKKLLSGYLSFYETNNLRLDQKMLFIKELNADSLGVENLTEKDRKKYEKYQEEDEAFLNENSLQAVAAKDLGGSKMTFSDNASKQYKGASDGGVYAILDHNLSYYTNTFLSGTDNYGDFTELKLDVSEPSAVCINTDKGFSFRVAQPKGSKNIIILFVTEPGYKSSPSELKFHLPSPKSNYYISFIFDENARVLNEETLFFLDE